MNRVYLGLGSNLGDPLSQVEKAFKEISALSEIIEPRCSKLYKTAPVSPLPQPDFINAACTFFTRLQPVELLRKLQNIEKNLGKIPKKKTEPRLIDIDILLYGERLIDTDELKVPHPAMLERLFVLAPLSDLVDEIFVPQVGGRSVKVDLRRFKRLNDENCWPLHGLQTSYFQAKSDKGQMEAQTEWGATVSDGLAGE